MEQEEFLKKLISTFRVEAKEHVAALTSGLIELEKGPAPEKQARIIEVVFREAHSLKGAARAVNMAGIEKICQALEDLFSRLKRREITLNPGLFDVLHEAADAIDRLLQPAEADAAAKGKDWIRETIWRLEGASAGARCGAETGPRQSAGPAGPSAATADTVRISTAKLGAIMLQAEELLSAKLSTAQRSADLREISASLAAWKKEFAKAASDLRLKTTGSDGPRLNEFIRSCENHIAYSENRLNALMKAAMQDQHTISMMVGNLLDGMKNVLMLPFSSLLEIFPKVVRDLSHTQGKEAELIVRGGDVEIDRRILEEIKDPLMHLVRNCVDHGIEKREERTPAGKPPMGTITIAISRPDSKKVEILVSDDGTGIDAEKVKAAAVKLGLLSRNEADGMSSQQALPLIFQSGVSTSPIITDMSGRGLGLAIVQERVGRLGGTVSCEATPRKGSTFRMILPLSLATSRGVLVRLDEQFFVIPTVNMERMQRIRRTEIRTVENRETVMFGGYAIPFLPLHSVLELPRKARRPEDGEYVQAVVLNAAEKLVAFGVDEVLHEQDVLVKGMGRQLSRVRNIAGATVLGTGKVVPILNVADLIKSAVRGPVAPAGASAVSAEETTGGRKSVLVVEDSITARTLLKNILEAAGYYVRTSVDGLDALAALKTEVFDIVVSDVDMPRMNGFDLTARIREDKKLADMPVVLVTALESREDREHGIDVGASAYIVKSSFDQSNLLDVMRRLI